MNLMTESKVIQEADEAQQFEQNPHYYNRNIDPAQVSSQINFISKDVNSFINKLHIANFHRTNLVPKYESNSELPQSQKSKYCLNHKKNSQISQISSNTQSLIEDLSWMHSLKSINQLPKPRLSDQSLILQSQPSFILGATSLRKYSVNKNSSLSKVSYQNDSQNYQQPNSKSLNISRKKFQRQTKNNLPKTVDFFNKSNSNFKLTQNSHIANINKIYFDNQKNIDFLEEFDDKDTVVNEPHSNRKRKFTKTKLKNLVKKQSIKQQSYEKLTKKKLLEKILQLQSSFEQLKNQQIKKNANFRHNQALLAKPPLQGPTPKPSSIQDYNIKVNPKVGRKYTIDQQSKQKIIDIASKKNTLSQIERDSESRNSYAQPQRKKSSVSSSQRKSSKSKIGDKEKISLSKWVSQVWQDL